MSNPEHLNTSELGTKSYWDAAYTTERQNFSSNPDDEGTIWFSDAGAEERMLSFLENLSDEGQLHKDEASDEKAAEWSNTAAQRLHKTRTTQTSGTLSVSHPAPGLLTAHKT